MPQRDEKSRLIDEILRKQSSGGRTKPKPTKRMARGGRTLKNTNRRLSGRTQTNPKGVTKKR